MVKRNGILACLLALAATSLQASEPSAPKARSVGWDDLTVKIEFEDPFEALTQAQLMELSIYARVSRLQAARPASVSGAMQQEATDAERSLKDQNIDVAGLLERREEIKQLRKQRASATNPALAGKVISMPGYALPLEYDGKRVTEFLLVPWVGACIHTPPPPPNQIVHVKLTEGFEVASRFQPVTVTGTVSIGGVKRSLYLVDGSAEINIGYTLGTATAVPYKAPPAKSTAASTPRRARDRTPHPRTWMISRTGARGQEHPGARPPSLPRVGSSAWSAD
jgi:hypothetical protein